MSDLVGLRSPEGIADAEAALGGVLDTRPCPKCQSDLSGMPKSARYCPRCGWDLQQPSAIATVAVPPAISNDPLEHQPIARLPEDHPAPVSRPEPIRSPILRGFATALYRLGARYERGLGASYNFDEARRCYFKAAKLGNSAAIARLGAALPSNNPPEFPDNP